MVTEIKIADKPTLDQVKTDVASVNTNVDSVKTNIGASGDTANQSGTTIFSRIAWLVSKFVSNWTDARAVFLDAAISSRAASAEVGTRADAQNMTVNTTNTLMAYVKGLVTNWTTTKAGYLDATVSSRAASSTALSNAVWTNALATNLSTLASAGGSSQSVKSVQRGVFSYTDTSTGSKTINISTINPSKSLVILNGATNSGNNALIILESLSASSFVVNSNSLTVSTLSGSRFSWQVIEFY